MLLWQGVAAFRLYTGMDMPVEEVKEKFFMNKEKKNIFLIGFMGAGKSTIARAIKQKLGYPVVEMDERIVKEQGMPISKIFETYGELYFRELETKLIQSLNQQEPTIVSCGGGVAMRQENVDCMRDGGSVVFLTATPQTIYERVKTVRTVHF